MKVWFAFINYFLVVTPLKINVFVISLLNFDKKKSQFHIAVLSAYKHKTYKQLQLMDLNCLEQGYQLTYSHNEHLNCVISKSLFSVARTFVLLYNPS